MEIGDWRLGVGKKLRGAFFALILCSPISILQSPAYAFDPCNPEEEPYKPIAERYTNGLVFKIEKCGVEPSYLMGTIHTDNEQVIDKIAYAFDIMAASKSAHFETLFEGEDINQQLQASYFPEESPETLETYVGRDYLRGFADIIARDYPDLTEMVYYRMRPWAAAMILQYPKKTASGLVLDEQLQAYAKQRKVPVYGIESGKEMMKFFEDMSQEESTEFFKFSVDNYNSTTEDMEKLTAAYISGSIDQMEELAEDSIKQMRRSGIMKGFEDKLIFERSEKMVDRTIEYVDKGGAFIAVGTLHLPGEKGMLKLFEDKGYYIEVENEVNLGDIQ